MKYHPASDVFPLMEGDEFHALVDDIKRNGLIVPITLMHGMILDGRNRYRACEEAGVKTRYQKVLRDLDPWSHVWSVNATRRHLDAGTHVCCLYECKLKSSEWLASREQAKAKANRKRSKATKAQPRTEDGQRLASGVVSPDTTPETEWDWERDKLAEEAGTSSATAGRAIALTKSHPDLAAQVRSGDQLHDSVVSLERSRMHSEKPEYFRNLIDERVLALLAGPPRDQKYFPFALAM